MKTAIAFAASAAWSAYTARSWAMIADAAIVAAMVAAAVWWLA